METYIEPKNLVDNPNFHLQKKQTLKDLSSVVIDPPIRNLIRVFNQIPYTFTLQCCYGHFVYEEQLNLRNISSLPTPGSIEEAEYRLAYIAFCVDNNKNGKELIAYLKNFTSMDSDNIQFCSAEWFWERQVNSYALQVVPERYKNKDIVILDYEEALRIEKIKDNLFHNIYTLITKINEPTE